MADINVLVTVDTENVTQENVNSTVVLTDNNGDSDDVPGDSSTFDIIKKGGGVSIEWEPVSKNGTDTVTITGINKVSGDDCFANLPAQQADGAWLASIVDNDGDETLELEYDIVFTVSNKPGETFTLDPKIKIPPGEGEGSDDESGSS